MYVVCGYVVCGYVCMYVSVYVCIYVCCVLLFEKGAMTAAVPLPGMARCVCVCVRVCVHVRRTSSGRFCKRAQPCVCVVCVDMCGRVCCMSSPVCVHVFSVCVCAYVCVCVQPHVRRVDAQRRTAHPSEVSTHTCTHTRMHTPTDKHSNVHRAHMYARTTLTHMCVHGRSQAS